MNFLFGNSNIDIVPMILNDNSIFVEHVHSVNSVTEARGPKGLPESNEELDANRWFALSRIAGSLGLPDGMDKTKTQK